MSYYKELIHEEERKGFTIQFWAHEELMSPDDSFDFENEEERQDLYEKLNAFQLVWFCAEVKALKNGVELGNDYLGGCCYESYEQFVEDNDYYADMVNSAITEAKEEIKNLCIDYKESIPLVEYCI